MTMSEWTVLGNAETVKALFRLKKATRAYRQEMTAANALQMKDAFPQAAAAAADNAAAWAKIMYRASAGVLQQAVAAVDAEKLAALAPDSPVYDLFEPKAAEEFKKYLQKQASLNAKIAKAEQPSGSKTRSGRGAKAKEEDAAVGELRAEILAAIDRDKKLSEAEKDERRQALAAAEEIKVQAKGAKCKLSFGDFAIDTMLAREGVQMPGKFSKYAGLSAETAKTLKNGKYATVAGLQAKSAKAAETRAAKKQKEEAEEYKNWLKERDENAKELPQKVVDLLAAAVPGKVFDDVGGENLLASVCQEPKQAAAAFCLSLANGVMNNRTVWSLFRENNNDDCFDSSSFYEKCVQNTVREHQISPAKEAAALYEACRGGAKTDLKSQITKHARAVAGLVLPYEEAKKLLQQEVYKNGMAVRRDDRFDMDKFNFMNEVLGEDGYRIQLCRLPVGYKTAKEAKPLSEEILADMRRADGIKALKNKEIALMYRLGELKKNKPGADLGSPSASQQVERLYNTFMQVFYNAEPHRSGGLYDKTYETQWRAFVGNGGNMQKADAVYGYFNREAERAGESRETALARWLGNLEKGNYADPGNPLVSSSAHHVFYRRFAGAVENPAARVNAADNVTPVISMHPADVDMHKDEEHRFDMKEIYLFERDGTIQTGSFNSVKKGDTLLMPVVMKRQADGSFRPLMEPDTLLAGDGLAVKEPKVAGRSNGVAEKSVWADLPQAGAYFSDLRPPRDGDGR